ncbi:hypothetical protein BDV25DRAFT_139345 [Aspergillus avenaceus]|uniref:Major facilitator superfamily (MFS) profile domain-containing protein n=1 Tax=Aspergillus avenaceus TaxID=36643 RepID=A0A5N6TXT9_ASPAV|nr:hypothetical protein BDV25DRAFT_139345 [Aspergillus avenaceus]
MTFLVGRPLNLAITATAGSGFLLFGYDQGVMSGLLSGDAFVATFPEIDTTASGHGSSSLQGTVVAIYEIGCFLGALLALAAGEKVGRRMCILAGCVVLSIGAALQCSAYTIPHMIVGRIVAGVGNGLNTSTIPVWHSELSKAESRGKGLAIELAINIFGVMTAYWVDYGMSYVTNEAQFRFPIALQILFAILTFIGSISLPESPRWLIAHGRHTEARRVLWAIQPNAHSITENDVVVNEAVAEITQAIVEEQSASEEGSFRMVFKNGPQRFFHRTLLGMGGQMMQQMSGVNLITYYNTVIFEQSVGMSHNLALLMAGFNGVAYFVSTLVPVWTIDRLGRRKLMLFAVNGQCACMAILAGTVWDGSHAAGIVATVMLFLFNFFFGVGLLAIPWLLPAEYSPLAIRTRSAALATATNWIFTFLVVEITPVSIENIGYRTYIYFAVFNFCFIPIIYLFYPETRNLTLEQIDRLFTGEKVQLHWHSSMGLAGEVDQRMGEKDTESPCIKSLTPRVKLPESGLEQGASTAVGADENVRDEAKPTCTGCRRRGDKCQWRILGSFREANIKVLEPEHPSMNQSVGRSGRQSKFKILNVAPPSSRKERSCKELTPSERAPSAEQQTDPRQVRSSSPPAVSYPEQSLHVSHESYSPCDNQGPLSSLPGNASFYAERDIRGHRERGPEDGTADRVTRFAHDGSPTHPYIHSSPEFVVDELTALRTFSNNASSFVPSGPEPYQGIASPLFNHGVFSDPANFTNDVFLPGSAYEALHTTLRNRQLWTARSDIPSRCSSPASVPELGAATTNNVESTQVDAYSRPRRAFELSSDRENVLWQNYLNEICLWLDMFDNHRHFASTFPQMAKSAPHLRYSILALSARQMERQQNAKSQSESLSLYQEAIHLLLPELESKTTPVIASCVILCVLEMLSCNPKEWRRHLDGCAYLIQAAEINGFSGKEEQALFWCFARMDVCGGLISEEETIIPIHHWIPKDMSPGEASQLFLASNISTFDTYANYTVYLCAQTLGVLFGGSAQISPSCVSCQYLESPGDRDSYVHRWKRLFDSVEQWHDNRPNQMKYIFTVPAGQEKPFPTVLYGNGAAISGNQLYHASALLLLQRKPKTLSLSRRPKSVLWHARQICAISASNSHHGCWTNALQPLWLAGKVMSHYSEHAAIIETLTRIERETGWATAWRVEDLREFWGEDDEGDECFEAEMECDVSIQTPRSARSQ